MPNVNNPELEQVIIDDNAVPEPIGVVENTYEVEAQQIHHAVQGMLTENQVVMHAVQQMTEQMAAGGITVQPNNIFQMPAQVYYDNIPKKKKKSLYAPTPVSTGRGRNHHKSYLESWNKTCAHHGWEPIKELEDPKATPLLMALHSGDLEYSEVVKAMKASQFRAGKASELFGRPYGKIYTGVLLEGDNGHIVSHGAPFTHYTNHSGYIQPIVFQDVYHGSEHIGAIHKDAKCVMLILSEVELSFDMRSWPSELVKAYFAEQLLRSARQDGFEHTVITAGSYNPDIPGSPPKDKTTSLFHGSKNPTLEMRAWRAINTDPSRKQVKKNREKFREYQKKSGGLPSPEDIAPIETPVDILMDDYFAAEEEDNS